MREFYGIKEWTVIKIQELYGTALELILSKKVNSLLLQSDEISSFMSHFDSLVEQEKSYYK